MPSTDAITGQETTRADESVPEGGEGNGPGLLGSREVGGRGSGIAGAGLAPPSTAGNTDLSDAVAVHAHQSTCVVPRIAGEMDLMEALAPAGAWLAAARAASASSVCERRCAWHGC